MTARDHLKMQYYLRLQWIMKRRLTEASTPREPVQERRVFMAVMQPPEPAFDEPDESQPTRKH